MTFPNGARFLLIVAFWVLLSFGSGTAVGAAICEIKGCNCTDKTVWTVVNCTFGTAQNVTLQQNSINPKVVEIYIIGGHTITFKDKSFNSLAALSMLYISSTQEVVFESHSFYNSTSPSLRVEIENCDKVAIRLEAFVKFISTIHIAIIRANRCEIDRAAFSKLLNASFQDIKYLELAEQAFEISKKDEIIKHRHGSATRIDFDNVYISKIPQKVFYSTLSQIRIQNSKIKEIESQAFVAPFIESIVFINTTIDTIKSNACSNEILVTTLKFSKCNITTMESMSIKCAINNFTIEHSQIKDIETGAVESPIPRVEIIDNNFLNVQPSSFQFSSWNKISFEQNVIKNLGNQFINGEPITEPDFLIEFSFVNNDIFNLQEGSLRFLNQLKNKNDRVHFRDNYFNKTCSCGMNEWFSTITGNNKTNNLLNTSFCIVDDLLSRCFQLKVGIINVKNFTDLICNESDKIKCEPYKGEVKIVNATTFKAFDNQKTNHSWLILTLTVIGLLIIAGVATFIFLIISGGKWLKRKGYLRNIHYNQNEVSNEDEQDTIVTLDQDSEEQKLDIPEELTLDYLEFLKKRLEDPMTHHETSEIIEKLYEMFIIEDGYENNNRQEEAHLYEELANMQTQIPDIENNVGSPSSNGPLSILKLMEERFNLQFIDNEDENHKAPPLVSEYSEPSDAEVHLYSEVKNQKEARSENKNSLHKSNLSINNRPLPNKPQNYSPQAGPSSLNR